MESTPPTCLPEPEPPHGVPGRRPFFPARGSSQMHASKPLDQAVDAREADPRLKSAKPRRVHLRSLAARAACGILVVITTLLALPAAAQAQTKVPTDWSLIPSGLGHGDSFRLIFGSSTVRDGTPTDIATYNTWIQDRAAAGHTAIRAYRSGFRVVGSTSAVDARDNTGTTYTSADKGVPIYWLGGSKVADDYEDFYDGSWDNERNPKDESGSARELDGSDENPMTGSTHAGTKDPGFALGSYEVTLGRPFSSASGNGPLSSNSATAKTNSRAFYGLSAVFTVKTPPTLSIADASAAENASHLLFDVRLSRSLPNTVKVDFETISGGTATEGVDYHARRTYTHVILAGDRTAQMGFALIEDTVDDAGETVKARLSNARVVDAYGEKVRDLDITTSEATGTITAPTTTTTNVSNLTIGIQDTTGDEDNGYLVFRVRLSRKYDEYVCYDFETVSGGTATEGMDYSKRPKVGQWMQTGKRVDKPFVRIIDDSENDDGETVKVKISNARLCEDASQTLSITSAEATGTIRNTESASGDNNWSEESAGAEITAVPALPLAGIGLLGLLLALFGSRAVLDDRRRLDASRGK